MIMIMVQTSSIGGYRLNHRLVHNFNKLSHPRITINYNNIVKFNNKVITITMRFLALQSSILDDIEDEEELISFRNIASSYLKSKFFDCYGKYRDDKFIYFEFTELYTV